MNKLLDMLADYTPVPFPGFSALKDILDKGESFINAGVNDYGYIMLKYIHYVDNGIMYSAKLSDSTATEIVITPENAALYTDEFLYIQTHYLKDEPAFLLNTNKVIEQGRFRWIGRTKEEVETLASQPKTTIFINDPHSPIEGLTTKVYIIDDPEVGLGKGLLEQVTDILPTITVVDDIADADMSVLCMSSVSVAPNKRFFEWLDNKNASVPLIKEVIERTPKEYFTGIPVLMFWPSNAIVASMFHPKEAMDKAADELIRASLSIK